MRTFATEAKIDKDGVHSYYINIEVSSERDFNALRKLLGDYWFGYKEPEDYKIEKISKEFNKLNKLVDTLPLKRNYEEETKWCSNFHRTIGRLEKAIEEAKND